MVGRTISHYEIVEKLGEGGMGVVYKARDTHLDRFVAIKVLPPEKVADAERKRRFVQEAKSASALNHPNIITIYDIANENGIDFISMEYVPGKALSQLITRKGLPLGEALKYAVQIADALATAHAAGIIHRDLKPGNVMISGTERRFRQGAGFRPGQADGQSRERRAGIYRDHAARRIPLRAKAPSWGPSPTCRRSRPRGRRWTGGATSSVSARCSMKW